MTSTSFAKGMYVRTMLGGIFFVVAVFALWGVRTHRAAAAELPELIELAPGNSAFIGYVNLAELRKDFIIEQLAKMAAPVPLDPEYAEFVTATGFDYARDLDRIVVATDEDHTLAVADGRFDQRKIEQYASRKGRLEQDGERPVYAIKSAKTGHDIRLAFLGPHRLAFAQGGRSPQQIVGPPATLDAAMRQRLSRVAGAPAFAGWRVPQATMQAHGGATDFVFAALKSVRAIDLAVKPDGKEMLISAEGECEDDAQAQKLAGTLGLLRTFLPAGLADPKMRGGLAPESAALLAHLVQGAAISTDSERVRLVLRITPQMIGTSAGGQ
jgi:hypothetical protein